ncbi:hypothetical protein ABKN59_003504 [Abortiporus biennis]
MMLQNSPQIFEVYSISQTSNRLNSSKTCSSQFQRAIVFLPLLPTSPQFLLLLHVALVPLRFVAVVPRIVPIFIINERKIRRFAWNTTNPPPVLSSRRRRLGMVKCSLQVFFSSTPPSPVSSEQKGSGYMIYSREILLQNHQPFTNPAQQLQHTPSSLLFHGHFIPPQSCFPIQNSGIEASSFRRSYIHNHPSVV